MSRTRAEALAYAAEWAESAHRTYARAWQAHTEAQQLDANRPPVALASPEARRLADTADVEYRNAAIEAALATAWATIAATTPEEPQP